MSPLTVDISHWQPNFTAAQFAGFASAGVGQVIVKLGGANNGVYHSSDHPVKIAAARAAGLTVGHYWFNGRMGSVASQIAEIVDAGIGADDVLWWDVEGEGSMPAWTPAEVVTYATALNAAGIPFSRQGIYLSASPTRSIDWSPVVNLGLPVWAADYGLNDGKVSSVPLVGSWPRANLHQYTSVGRLPGYDGNLDLNITGPLWTVHALQQILNRIFIEAGVTPLKEDGRLGDATREVVRTYQKQAGLFPDGDPGTKTLTHLTARNGGVPVYSGRR